ncbi:MAG: SDR family NAD(P)-dependent oxidoreductase [Microthrixaceae bacterium]
MSITFFGSVVAITGAGSGIGRALALDLATRGANLALADIDSDGLAETVMLVEATTHNNSRSKVTATSLDVADRAAVEAWAAQVVEEHGKVNMVINNAGVALTAMIEGMSYEDFVWLMNINFWGVVYGTQAFLPYLKESGEGHVVNISSVFGLLSIPTQSAYNASKFAVRGYTDALRMELEIADEGVSSTTVHPGGIRTNIARNARTDSSALSISGSAKELADNFDRMTLTTPDKAASQILKAVQRNRRRALIGPDAKVFDLVSRLPAPLYQRVLVAGSRRSWLGRKSSPEKSSPERSSPEKSSAG